MSRSDSQPAFGLSVNFLQCRHHEFLSHARHARNARRLQHSSPRRRARRANNNNGISMEWRPSGLLRDAVLEKESHLEKLLEVVSDRPDHPLNLRLAFFSQTPSFRFSNSLRRSDGSLAIIPVLKRIERAADDTLSAVAPLENIGEDARYLACAGVDAFFLATDAPRTALDVHDLVRATRGVRVSNVDPGVPTARQDLIVHPIQIAEAAEAGASAVVIVAGAALGDLMELMNCGTGMGLEVIVECHTELERDYAMECGATILYLTNRDRSTGKMVPGTAEKLAEGVPHYVLTIGGGGIVTATDCWRLLDAGFNGVALGRTLLQSPRRAIFMQEIRSQKTMAVNPFAGGVGVPFAE